MAFGIGLVAALVALKKRNGETRLKSLQKRLKEKPKNKVKLYQYPVQKILSIVFVIVFAVGLEYFAEEIQKDMKDQMFKAYPLPEVEKDNEVSAIYLIPEEGSQNQTLASKTVEAHSRLNIKMVNLRRVISYIDLVLLVCLLSLILSLDLKVVTAVKGEKGFKTVAYSYLGLKSSGKEYMVQEGDRLGIWQLGETRFTHTNYYYSVRVLNGDRSCQVLRKSCMFDARQVVLKLSDQLQLPFSTKIKKIHGCVANEEDQQ